MFCSSSSSSEWVFVLNLFCFFVIHLFFLIIKFALTVDVPFHSLEKKKIKKIITLVQDHLVDVNPIGYHGFWKYVKVQIRAGAECERLAQGLMPADGSEIKTFLFI